MKFGTTVTGERTKSSKSHKRLCVQAILLLALLLIFIMLNLSLGVGHALSSIRWEMGRGDHGG